MAKERSDDDGEKALPEMVVSLSNGGLCGSVDGGDGDVFFV